MGGEEVGRTATLKWGLAGKHLVGDHAKRVEIGPGIGGGIRRGLLRRHVEWCAQRDANRGESLVLHRRRDRLGDAEIGDLGLVLGQEDVVGLDVAMDDAVPVSVGQRSGHLGENVYCRADG